MGQVPPRIPRDRQYSSRSVDRTVPPSTSPRKPKKKPKSKTLPIILILTLGIASFFVGYILHNPFIQKYGIALVKPKTTEDVFPGKQGINLMIIGRDYDYNNQDQVIKTHARSDLLMVAHLDFVNKKASLLSIPRDTKADIPGHKTTKINAAHAYGGPELAEKTVETNFGIPSDNYIALDFKGFEEAIDKLGGVDLAVDKKMDYDDNWGHLHIHLKPGQQHLNGEQAMGFVRFRHSDSDLVRTTRQQTLLAAIKEKMINPVVLTQIPEILTVIDKHVESDLNADQKVVIARYLHDLPRERISMATLPSKETSGRYVLTDWDKATPMIKDIFGVTPPENNDNIVRPRRRRRHHRSVSIASLP